VERKTAGEADDTTNFYTYIASSITRKITWPSADTISKSDTISAK
jgi:hypothetical protein